jgi:hypothetical protein
MSLRDWRGGLVVVGVALAGLGTAPGVASARASRPTVVTGAAANVGQTTVTLTGAIRPNGAATTYWFLYGATRRYGGSTPFTAAGSGRRRVVVAVPVGSLAPATTYHFRLVAQNRRGLVKGADRVFRTPRQPLGLTLTAIPNPLPLGGPTTLVGSLTGTGSAGRAVAIQGNPWPYVQGFIPVGNALLTDAQGAFSLPVLSVGITTQYRAVVVGRPSVASAPVVVGVVVRVGTQVRIRRHARRHRKGIVRFSGIIRPAHVGAPIAVQKRIRGNWVTIAQTVTRAGGASFSRYRKRVRLLRGGVFRVFATIPDGSYVSNRGRIVHLRMRR